MEHCQKENNIVIAGAGPSGVYCAIKIINEFNKYNFNDYTITIIDKANPLETILPTGNGRCNLTNNIDDIKEFASHYPRGEKFLYSIFSRYFIYDTLNDFENLGIKCYIQNDNRYFPCSNSAKEVKNKMLNFLFKSKNVHFKKETIMSIKQLSKYSHKVISCGTHGKYDFIKEFSHKIVDLKPALCALNIKDPIYPKGVSVKTQSGDFVFTDTGISGPLAFQISSINAYSKFPYEIKINLFDSLELIKLAKKYPKKAIGNLISSFIPKSLAKTIIKNFDKHACEISENELLKYSTLNLEVISHANKGEIVMAGGVSLNEIDKNCKSKLKDNLWFCGEILNIDGFCGGFNLQNCWSTGAICAFDIVEKIINQ